MIHYGSNVKIICILVHSNLDGQMQIFDKSVRFGNYRLFRVDGCFVLLLYSWMNSDAYCYYYYTFI